jgi:hypothetical protein
VRFLARKHPSSNRKIFEISVIVHCFCHLQWLAEMFPSCSYLMRDATNTQFYAFLIQSTQQQIINLNRSDKVTICYYNKCKLIYHTPICI